MRAAFTILAIVIGLLVVAAVFFAGPGSRPAANQPTQTASQAPATQPAAEPVATTAPAPATQPVERAAAAVVSAPATQPALTGLRAEPATFSTIALGSTEEASDFRMKVELTPWGAGVRRILLSGYWQDLKKEHPYVVQDGVATGAYPLAARGVWIDGQFVSLYAVKEGDRGSSTWSLETAGEETATLRARIVAADGSPVLDVVRTYRLDRDSFDLRVEQRFVNRTGGPLKVTWEQNAQGDVPPDDSSYMGDQRVVAVGYYDLDYGQREHVFTDDTYLHRWNVLEAYREKKTPLWPNPKLDAQTEPVWIAALNRYFAAVVHPPVTVGSEGSVAVPAWFSDRGNFRSINLLDPVGQYHSDPRHDQRHVVVSLTSAPLEVAPGETNAGQLSLAMYAGPRDRDVFAQPAYKAMGFGDELIVYSLGGCCEFLTFQWLAHGLLWFLEGIHWLLADWGVAIIILVLIVRLLLHPITKRGQIQMTKTGKQMQMLQPEIAAIKKRYKDDQTAQNQAIMQLYRERGVNFLNMLGCAPMMLQTPIWIALYAMLYFAIELRHEPAFYGVFQAISGGKWLFLADLSTQDNFIQIFDSPKPINLYFIHPNFQSINVLPLVMMAVFYFQQKLTAVPPANEEQARQQKMMKWMTLIFPIFLYSAPCGLTLYMCASTGAGILDSWIVRRHIKREEEEGRLFAKTPPKPRKPGSFQDRMGKWIEQKQRELQQRQQGGGKARGK